MASVTGLHAQQATAHAQFPVGALKRSDELPDGRFRKQLEKLPPTAKGRAMQWLRSFHFPAADVESLHADQDGGICYSCDFTLPDLAAIKAQSIELPVTAEAAVPISPFPSQLVFHSRPGAPNVIYLNFVGENVTGTQWNTTLGRTEIPAVPFSNDTDFSTFSDSEQTVIKRVWQRVSEDYAGFDVDVTTGRPSSLTNRTAMALITRSTDANGAENPSSGSGGVAYVNVFGTSTFASYRPAWIYYNNLATNESYIAEAASHEVGHNLGLSHDGTTTLDYYGGHGSGDISWGPIMGTGYNRNVSQWSKGEYYLANNTQDDLTIISGKLPYRNDDHGDTRANATPLVVTGGTQIVSTTPENDPTNSNTSNKGVFERNTDLDVFSFVTGNGPVQLNISPWVTPSGTRGGNLDLLVELRDDGGTLLLSNNEATKTSAVIATTLAEGRYYLYLKNSAVGDPLASSPTGYTSYASLGQYFISGTITGNTTFVDTPLASLQSTNLTQSEQATVQFTVTYSNSVAMDVTTIDSSDVRVTGPSNFNQLAQLVSLDVAGNGTPRTATYAVTAPGGGNWSPAQNGLYQVSMEAGQVKDTAGTAVAAGLLGQFNVAVTLSLSLYSANMDTNPGWTVQPSWEYGSPNYGGSGPSSGYTGTRILGFNLSGNYSNGLSVKYATTPVIDTTGSTSLTLRFKRWLRTRNNDPVSIEVSTDGASWLSIWSTTTQISDSSWKSMEYPLPAGVAGSPTLRLRWGLSSSQSQNDIGWNIDDVELTGSGSLDSTPPQASLAVTNLTVEGVQGHPCTVTYSDSVAVKLASLNSSDLLVTGPNGYSKAAGFIGADLPMDGSPITGSYSILSPEGTTWKSTNNGVYTITLLQNEVEDSSGNRTPVTTLGTFSVNIISPLPGTMAVTGSGNLTASGTVGGPFTPGSVVYTLTNPGGSAIDWTATKTASWLDLSPAAGSLAAGASTTVTVTINSGADALPAATYTDTLAFTNTTNGSGNTTRGVSLTVNSPGELVVESSADLTASGTVGGPFSPGSTVYTLTNSGGTAMNWTATKDASWLDLSPAAGSLAAGASTTVTVTINSGADALTAATYTDTLAFTNTTNGSGNTTRNVSLAINSPGELVVESSGNLTASGTVGGPFTPGSMVYTLTNPGGSAIDWTATKTASWLDLSPAAGSLAAGASTTVTVTINSDADALTAATYTDILAFTNTTNASGNTTRNVSLTINSPGELVVESSGNLTASGTVGGPFTPGSVVYTLTNSGGTAINWTATQDASWLDLSPAAGSLAAGASTTVTVAINSGADALPAATYTDTLAFTNTTNGSGNTTRDVSLTVNSPGELVVGSSGNLTASGTVGGPFNPGSVVYTLTNSGGTAINWTATKDASWLDLSPAAGSLAAGASTTVTVAINSGAIALIAGTYDATLNFGLTISGGGTSGGTQLASTDGVVTREAILKVLDNIKVIGQHFSETGAFEIVIEGSPDSRITLEGTTDFIKWTNISSSQIGEDGTVTLADPESPGFPTRFYRASISSP